MDTQKKSFIYRTKLLLPQVTVVLFMLILYFTGSLIQSAMSPLSVQGQPAVCGTVYENLPYGDKECQVYDLYIPSSLENTQSQGVILFIHGGSWIRGDKSSMSKFCEEYAQEGYITATMNYTLLSENNRSVTLDDTLDDITECISVIKKDLASLGINADKLAISGNSAGGHITLMYAYSRTDETEIPISFIFPRTGPTDMSFYAWEPVEADRVTWFLSMFTGQTVTIEDYIDGSADDLIASMSPVTYIDENTVPTLLAYAGNDTVVGMNHYEAAKPYLDKYGVEYDYVLFPKSGHTLKDDPDCYEEFKGKVLLWAEKYFGY